MNAVDLIAKFEGYAPRAYWDVNAWRIGYGSDTEGPAQFRVVQGMTTTKDRAKQNLAKRVPEFEAIAARACEPSVWAKLTDEQRAVCTSLTYNYGRLPVKIDPNDAAATVARIKARGADNDGVNRKRRIQEANFYLTGSVTGAKPSGPAGAVIIGAAATVGAAQQAASGNMNVAIIATILIVFFSIIKGLMVLNSRPAVPAPSPLDKLLADMEQKREAYAAAKQALKSHVPEIENAIAELQTKLQLIEA
jgi:GH24 family phage-related lysozyme (muramidase)